MTNEFFQEMMDTFQESYGLKMSERQTAIWYGMLGIYPDEVLAVALIYVLDNVEKFPSIANFKNFVRTITQTDPDAAFEEALRIAPRLKNPVYHNGKLVPVDSSDPLILIAIEEIGVDSIRMCKYEDLGTLRAQFKSAFLRIQQKQYAKDIAMMVTPGKDSYAMSLVRGDVKELSKTVFAIEQEFKQKQALLMAGKVKSHV